MLIFLTGKSNDDYVNNLTENNSIFKVVGLNSENC